MLPREMQDVMKCIKLQFRQQSQERKGFAIKVTISFKPKEDKVIIWGKK